MTHNSKIQKLFELRSHNVFDSDRHKLSDYENNLVLCIKEFSNAAGCGFDKAYICIRMHTLLKVTVNPLTKAGPCSQLWSQVHQTFLSPLLVRPGIKRRSR